MGRGEWETQWLQVPDFSLLCWLVKTKSSVTGMAFFCHYESFCALSFRPDSHRCCTVAMDRTSDTHLI